MRKVIIFRSRLLPKSETFVLSQTKGMKRLGITFLGITKVFDGILLKMDNAIWLNEGGLIGYLRRFYISY